jgi:hypothetical protein
MAVEGEQTRSPSSMTFAEENHPSVRALMKNLCQINRLSIGLRNINPIIFLDRLIDPL